MQDNKNWMKTWTNRAVALLYTASVLLGSIPSVTVFAQEQEYICEQEEHVHGQHCPGPETVLVCGEAALDIHVHADSCRDAEGNLVCGKADTYIHEHTPVCFDGEELVCTLHYLPAHTHEAACYDQLGELACGKEEAIPHTHSQACYEEEALVCQSLELPVHTHNEQCVETRMDCPVQAHSHTEACLAQQMTETIPETTAATVPETTAATVPEMTTETVPETTAATVPETTTETVPETTAATVPETTAETQPQRLTASAPRAVSLTGKVGDNATYTISDNTLTIRGTGPIYDYENEYRTPWYTIRNSITKVVVEEGITRLGNYLFGRMQSLSSASLPTTLTEIGDSTFWGCRSLHNLELPENVTKVGSYAFANSGLESMVFPGKKIEFGNATFYYCISLTSVTLPSEQEIIVPGMFYHCDLLSQISLPATLKTISYMGFYYCALTSIQLPEGLQEIEYEAFHGCPLTGNIRFPVSLTTVGSKAFANSKLSALYLDSANLTTLGPNAFFNNTNLTNVVIGDSVETLYQDTLDHFQGVNVSYSLPCAIHLDASVTDTENMGVYKKNIRPGFDYFLNEQGVLYCLEGGTASLCVVPDTVETVTVPEFLMVEGTAIPVTGVDEYALEMAEKLITLNFAAPEAITRVEDFAMADRPTLISVNGLTKVSEVKALLKNADLGIMILSNTGLEEDLSVTEEPLVIQSAGTTLMIENLGKFQNLTGEYVTHRVTVSNNSGQNQSPRIYLHFSDSQGQIQSHNLGQQDYETDDGSVYSVILEKAAYVNTWYFTFPTEPGDTLTFNFVTNFASGATDGGELLVWGSFGEELNDDYFNAIGHHRVVWSVKESVTTTTVKNVQLKEACRIIGQGTAKDHAKLENLAFQIDTTAVPEDAACGHNPLQSIDYTVTVTLPEEMRWNQTIVNAYNAGNYEAVAYGSAGAKYNVFADNTSYLLMDVDLGGERAYITPVFTDKQVSFTVTVKNKNQSPDTDQTGAFIKIIFGNNLIEMVDDNHPEAGKKFKLECETSPVYHYRYSTSQGEKESCTYTVQTTKADLYVSSELNIEKPANGTFFQCTVTMENRGSEDMKIIRWVEQEMLQEMMISPENMDQMFADTYGQYLTVTITDMSVHNNSHLAGLGQNQDLANTSYQSSFNGMLPEADGCLLAEDVDLTVGWNDQGQLVVWVQDAYTDENGSTVAAAEYPVTGSVRSVFDSIGLMPDWNTFYEVNWYLERQVILYSGQTREFVIHAGLKDEYCRSGGDAMETSGLGSVKSQPLYSHVWFDAPYYHSGVNRVTGRVYIYNNPRGLTASYMLDGLEVDDTVQQTGSVARVQISDSAPSADPYGHPLTARIRGGQILMVSAEENPQLAAVDGIRELTYGGETYYLLDKPGTYENLYIGSDVATLTVSDYVYALGHDPELEAGQDGYLQYQINWFTETIATHDVMFLLLPAGQCATAMYRTSLEVWANNHQGRRLYTRRGMWHTFISSETDIVTQRGETPQQDQLTDHQFLPENSQVTYRVKLTGQISELASQLDMAASFTGSVFYNILPAIDCRWEKEDVQMQWVYDAESVSVTNPDAWTVESGTDEMGNPLNTIRWSDDFVMEFRGASEAYLYITVQYPQGEAWNAALEDYDGQRLENRFIFFKPNTDGSDTVYHDPVLQAQAQFIVGVNKTAVGYGRNDLRDYPNTDENSRLVYSHWDYNPRVVQYYLTVYNDGNTRLYLNDIQVHLPDNFLSGNPFHTDGTRYDAIVTDDEGRTVQYISPYANYWYTPNRNKIVLEVEEYTMNGRCHYDQELDAYYLTPGEAITIRIMAHPDYRVDEDGIATLRVAMPYRDLTGGGLAEGGSSIVGMDYLDTVKNDGECELLTNAEAAEAGFTVPDDPSVSQWLFSSVTMMEQKNEPDLSMSVSDIDFRNEVGDGNYAQDSATITWTITAHNYSGSAMYDYTIVDTIQRDYDFTGKVYATITYGSQYVDYQKFTRRVELFDISELTPGVEKSIYAQGFNNVEVTYIPWSEDGVEMATLRIRFDNYACAIPEGGSLTLELSTKNVGTNRNQTYTNNVYIIPGDEEWNEDAVVKGNVVTLDGVKAVQASSQVTVASHFATAASKTVTQTGNPQNTVTSKGEAETIYVHAGENKVNYTLSVSCFEMTAASGVGGFQKLVLIDNLPEPGDHNTFDDAQPRYSDFKVSFAPDTAISVSVKDKYGVVTPLDPDNYIVQFSKATSFTQSDWTGASDAKWTTDPTGARSFRIILGEDETGYCLGASNTLLVNFEAVVDDTPEAGETAWNSFGYYYTVKDSLSGTVREMRAEPMKVGVRIIGTPVIQVELKDPEAGIYTAQEDMKFSYLIVEGRVSGIQTRAGEDPFDQMLKGKTFTVADVTVEAGASEATNALLNPVVYSYVNGNWQPTATQWEWKDGTTYTVIQLPGANEEDYALKSIGGQAMSGYTFTYNKTERTTIRVVNVRRLWNVKVLTANMETDKLLSGAWHGLYSPVESQKLTGDLPAQIGLSVDRQITQDGVTYYLCAVAQSDDAGAVLWEDLTEENYLVKQLQQPTGYHLNSEIFRASRPEDVYNNTVELTVENATGYELYRTGGMGTQPFLVQGGALMLLAAAAYLSLHLLRKKTH